MQYEYHKETRIKIQKRFLFFYNLSFFLFFII